MSEDEQSGNAGATVELQSIITCPECGHRETETMPVDKCQFYYECKGCGVLLRPDQGDCCVYCSFGTVPCPPIQEARRKGNGSASCCES
jgi:rubredoxin